MTVSLSNKMEIIVRPEGEIFNHEYNSTYYYMEQLQRIIESVVDEIKKKRPDLPQDIQVIFETSNDDTEKCVHDFEVIEHDEIRDVIIFQCSKCRILGNARIK